MADKSLLVTLAKVFSCFHANAANTGQQKWCCLLLHDNVSSHTRNATSNMMETWTSNNIPTPYCSNVATLD